MSAKKRLHRVVASRFLSRAGSEAAFFVGVWGKAAFEFEATPTQLAIVMFALSMAIIAGTMVAGVLVDRFGPRDVLVYSHVAFVPAALAVLLAGSIPELAGLVAIWGFVAAPILTAGASFAPFLTRDEAELKHANSLIEGAGSAAFVVGPAVGALIVRFASVDWVFVIDAVTSIVAAAIVWAVRIERPKRAPGSSRALAEFTEGLRVSWNTRGVRYYIAAGTAIWLGFGSFGALEPLFFRDVVGTGIETIGWVSSVFGVGFLLGAFILDRLPMRAVSARTLAISVALTGVAGVLYISTPDLRIIVVGALCLGTAAGVFVPLQRTLIHRDTPHELLGRVISASEVVHRGSELLPLSFAPFLAAAFGVQPTLIIGLGAMTLFALVTMPAAVSIDRSTPPRPVAPEPVRVSTDEPISPNP